MTDHWLPTRWQESSDDLGNLSNVVYHVVRPDDPFPSVRSGHIEQCSTLLAVSKQGNYFAREKELSMICYAVPIRDLDTNMTGHGLSIGV